MQAKELRIGNWVENRGEFIKVDGFIFWHYMYPVDPRHQVEISQLQPIPLTKDILYKCKDFGPTIHDGEDSFFNGDDVLIRTNDMSLFLHNEYDGSVHLAAKLKYVHQLQNLYFALTGQELEINI